MFFKKILNIFWFGLGNVWRRTGLILKPARLHGRGFYWPKPEVFTSHSRAWGSLLPQITKILCALRGKPNSYSTMDEEMDVSPSYFDPEDLTIRERFRRYRYIRRFPFYLLLFSFWQWEKFIFYSVWSQF